MPNNIRAIAAMRPVAETVFGASCPLPGTVPSISPQEQRAMEQMKGLANDLLTQGPVYANTVVYHEWATVNGIVSESGHIAECGMSMPKGSPKAFADLNRDERQAWEFHLHGGEVSRDAAIQCAQLLIGVITQTPDLRYLSGQVGFAHAIKGLMYTAQMEIATTFLPDINDQEARKFFGQSTTARDVLERNIGKVFHHEPFAGAESQSITAALLKSLASTK
jgi:hypothetical protein